MLRIAGVEVWTLDSSKCLVYLIPHGCLRIDEFNESVFTATIGDIELRMKLVEQGRQAHGAWFDTCLFFARAIGFPRFKLPYKPGSSVVSGEVPWRLFLNSRPAAELKHDLAPALRDAVAQIGSPGDAP